MIYSWRKGHFYVADVGPFLGGLNGAIAAEVEGNPLYHSTTETGPYGIHMVRADGSGAGHKFLVGPYPVCHAHQNVDVGMFINAFMPDYIMDENGRRREWNAEWLKKLKRGRFFPLDPLRWLGSKTLGPKHDFDEAKTEAALMNYLTTPGTRSRGKHIPR